MERLTDKNHNAINKCGEYSSCYSCHKETCYIKEMEEKLGELEDVLEEFELTSAEDLRNYLSFKTNMAIWEGELNYKNKIVDLEQELVELKQKAIVPKFQIGQECWGVVPNTIWSKGYTIHYKVKAFIPDNNGILLMLEDDITNIRYSYEHQVFATREEAEQKLAEIGGKDE